MASQVITTVDLEIHQLTLLTIPVEIAIDLIISKFLKLRFENYSTLHCAKDAMTDDGRTILQTTL